MSEQKEIKEPFCGACVAIPMALAGAGLGAAGNRAGTSAKRRKIMLCTGVTIAVISIIVALYFLMKCNDCGF